ncbi:single-stranded-DNA-specific exonuclease RecJ, partial [bacterium]|nr:single-stranded-DNA-specific exonuclease RecJ [bacterium]
MSQENTAVEWILREVPEGWEGLLLEGMPRILAKLMAQRGVSEAEVKTFLKPRLAELSDPFEIEEMDLAVERVLLAIDHEEEVTIYGDYDVDG